MPRMIPVPFDITKQIVVRREMNVAGRKLSPGDVFNHRQWAVNIRRVGQLVAAGFLHNTLEDVLVEEQDPNESINGDDGKDESINGDDGKDESINGDDGKDKPVVLDHSDLNVDSIVVLQAIAKEEGAPINKSKDEQRRLIIARREYLAGEKK